MKPQVVIVDDEQPILNLIRTMLRDQSEAWDLHLFVDSREAWEFLRTHPVDAIVSDVTMPHLTGIELLEKIRHERMTKDVPVAIMTGLADAEVKNRVLELGATDLLAKPFHIADLTSRLRNMLKLKQMQDELHRKNADLEAQVRLRTGQLDSCRMQVIWRLGKAAEIRDEETGEHVVRVALYSRMIAEHLGLPRNITEEIFLRRPLHDIGKIGVPDSILRKPGKLTEEERRTMESHCVIGGRILEEPSLQELCARFATPSHLQYGEADPVLVVAREIALSHHERWDGSGYPRQLAGIEIPQAARIVAVADVFDALTSVRPFKPAIPMEESLEIIRQGRNTQFDALVVDVFLKLRDKLPDVQRQAALATSQLMGAMRRPGSRMAEVPEEDEPEFYMPDYSTNPYSSLAEALG